MPGRKSIIPISSLFYYSINIYRMLLCSRCWSSHSWSSLASLLSSNLVFATLLLISSPIKPRFCPSQSKWISATHNQSNRLEFPIFSFPSIHTEFLVAFLNKSPCLRITRVSKKIIMFLNIKNKRSSNINYASFLALPVKIYLFFPRYLSYLDTSFLLQIWGGGYRGFYSQPGACVKESEVSNLFYNLF